MILEIEGNNLGSLAYWESAEKENDAAAVAAERRWGSRAER